MSSAKTRSLDDLRVDLQHLYREDVITDLAAAVIRRLVPIKPDGSADATREPIYTGSTQILTQAGMIPVSCELPAKTLEEALKEFPAAIKKAVEAMISEYEEMRRQASSRIVVPEPGQIPLDQLAGGPGGQPQPGGRRKIVLR